MIAIVDYRMGNLRSVAKALEHVGVKSAITSEAADIKAADKVIFPGVGSFSEGVDELDKLGLREALIELINDGKPFLGLCLGLHLLFEDSEEAPGIKGLGVLEGSVKRFPDKDAGGRRLKVPQIGWNSLNITARSRDSSLLKGINEGSFVYFVHSYYAEPKDKDIITTTTDYGLSFCSSLNKDNIYATQFHPEKSQETGLMMLKNFAEL